MERDCMIGHGTACFLKERMSDDSDIVTVHFCDDCGNIADKKKNVDVWVCPNCKDEGSGTSKVNMPYAFKTLIQELLTCRILMAPIT